MGITLFGLFRLIVKCNRTKKREKVLKLFLYDAIDRVESWIKRLPRKFLLYRSASDLFSNVLFDIAI